MQYDPGADENSAKLAATNNNREEFVLQLFRLFKLVTMHQMHNQAVQRSIGAAAQSFKKLLQDEQTKLTVLFGGSDIFVNGQPLKASRGTYESATELGQMLETLGANEISVSQDVQQGDIQRALESFVSAREQRGTTFQVTGALSVIYVDPSYLMGMDEDEIGIDEQIIRTYTSALVMLQRAHELWDQGQYRHMRIIKRIAQRLVMFSEEHDSALIQATALRVNGSNDVAEHALVSAMTAVVAARLLTRDIQHLTLITTSALCHHIGNSRLKALSMQEDDPFRMPDAPVALREDQKVHQQASTAVGMIGLAGLFDTALERLDVAYESTHFGQNPAPLFQQRIVPKVEALIVSRSHQLQHLLTTDEPLETEDSSLDDRLEVWMSRTSTRAELIVSKLICTALGIYPRGTVIRLSSGWQGVVLGTPNHPTCYSRPMVRLMVSPSGESETRDIHLSIISQDVLQLGHIEEVIHAPTEAQKAVRQQIKEGYLRVPQQAIDGPVVAMKRRSASHPVAQPIDEPPVMIDPTPQPEELEEPKLDTDVLSLTDVHARKMRLEKLRFLASLDDPTSDEDDSLFD